MSEERDGEERRPKLDRSGDLIGRKTSPCRKALTALWNDVKRAFEDQRERADKQMDYWDAYNCRLNDKQYYQGEAQIYVPIIHDAIQAVVTRLSNQLFPEGGHYVDATSDEPSTPQGIIALLDKYIRDGRVKTRVCKPLIRHGYLEGQLNLYVDWSEIVRETVSREKRQPTMKMAGEEIPLPQAEEIEDIKIEDELDARPACEVLHDSDVAIWPATADTIDEALAAGGHVSLVRRWSKAKIEKMKEAGHIREDAADALLSEMNAISAQPSGLPPDAEKLLAEMVGIRKHGSEATIWEVWHLLPLGHDGRYQKGGARRICRTFFGPTKGTEALGCVRNPYWNDRVPILSAPVEKIGGVAKGKSQVENVITLQYEANDAANEGSDSAHYAALPIVMRHPQAGKQPLVMNIAAVWDVDPNMVKLVEFPDLTPRAITRIQYCIQQIFQSLSINPSMLPQQTSQTRRNQAQVAQEQQVDLLTTTEGGSVLVEDIFTPLISWFVDLDYQFRDRATTARLYGTMGVRAQMEEVPPQQTRTQYAFRWVGVERARNAQTNQQKIAWINVARGLSQELQQAGKQIDFAVPLEESAMDLWGPHVGPQVVKDIRSALSMDPEIEDQMLADGHDVPIHPLDEDQRHLASHQRSAQQSGDPHQTFRIHIERHLAQMRMKQAAQQMQAMQQAMGGGQPQPGSPGARPSRGGAPPRQGAMPAMPRQMTGPPGMIRPDTLPKAGAVPMPRRM